MIVDYCGRRFSFSFVHTTPPKKPNYRATICTISEIEGKHKRKLISGTAACSPLDQFKKETGRKVSLTRALRAIPTPFEPSETWEDQPWVAWGLHKNKDLRKAFWDVYLQRIQKTDPKLQSSSFLIPDLGDVSKKVVKKVSKKAVPKKKKSVVKVSKT